MLRFLSTLLVTLMPFQTMAAVFSAGNIADMITTARDAGLDIEWQKDHGCWCPEVYKEFAMRGKPIDELDSACKNFMQCTRCVYDTNNGCSANVFDFNYVWDVNSTDVATCQNRPNSCRQKDCLCHVEFFNELIKSSSQVNATAVAGTEDACVPATGYANACCESTDGKWKVYDTWTHECRAGELEEKFIGVFHVPPMGDTPAYSFTNMPTVTCEFDGYPNNSIEGITQDCCDAITDVVTNDRFIKYRSKFCIQQTRSSSTCAEFMLNAADGFDEAHKTFAQLMQAEC